jgi:hypothetical protein
MTICWRAATFAASSSTTIESHGPAPSRAPLTAELCPNGSAARQVDSRRRKTVDPGPASASSDAVRPQTLIIRAATGPVTSTPSRQDRLTSVADNRIPRSRLNGTKPIGQRPVRKSIADTVRWISGSNGRPSGIRTSPLCTKMSASGPRGPNTADEIGRSACSRRAATISAIGACARRRASLSIPRLRLPHRTAI